MKFEARIIELKNGKKCTLAPTTAGWQETAQLTVSAPKGESCTGALSPSL